MARYLELTSDNFAAYSLELARILFGAASEVDVVAKRLCQELNANAQANNIVDYKREILLSRPQIVSATVAIPRFDLTLLPWVDWQTADSPVWWRAYNNVKHRRHTHFAEASLVNALNAVAGLFALLLFYYRDEGQSGKLAPDPSLLRIGTPFRVDRPAWGPAVNLYTLEQDIDD